MAQFRYTVIDKAGKQVSGQIDALDERLATQALQGRGFVVAGLQKITSRGSGLSRKIRFSNKPPMRQLVITTRQLATLFESQVSALKVFALLSESTENEILQEALAAISEEIKAGTTITQAMQKHPNVFSDFYVGMVRAGNESGTLSDTFVYLADYLERQYELTSKTKNALIYPAFVMVTFIGVMILMLTLVIPQLGSIILESGQEVPVYTKIVIAMSNFFVKFGWYLLVAVMAGAFAAWRYFANAANMARLDGLKLQIPIVGGMFKKLYLARMADNLNTMLSAGIPVLRALEITSGVIGNKVYEEVLRSSIRDVKGGQLISAALSRYEVIPQIMLQMMKVGEETGSLGAILKTLAKFYKREVDTAIDALIGLIEPVMIILLAIGVGFLLTAVLMPIYNLASAF
jgi:type IV pilus assembly protein PilC